MPHTYTQTYTHSDIETVFRRFKADLLMIAQSSRALSDQEALDYAHDLELFAKEGVLEFVDLTLLDGYTEVEAARYTVDASGDLSTSRPGGVMWQRVPNPRFRVVIRHTLGYSDSLKAQLKVHWHPTNDDVSHLGLAQTTSREYSSNGWALRRQDYRAR